MLLRFNSRYHMQVLFSSPYEKIILVWIKKIEYTEYI